MAELRNGSWRADYLQELEKKRESIVRNPENILAEILSQYDKEKKEDELDVFVVNNGMRMASHSSR